MRYKNIRFVYDQPAMVITADNKDYLVVGDLHIGMELALSRKGIHLFDATERMAERVKKIMNEFSVKRLIILGDVKESILYPEASEIRLLKDFFRALSEFEITIVAGNHDAHLAELIGHEVKREFTVGGFGFIHGNRKPDEQMMQLNYIISGHDHLSVRIRDGNGAIYDQKAWAICKLNKIAAKKEYSGFNEDVKLISIPAFNDLIMGTLLEKGRTSMLNPILNSGIFSFRSAEIYNTIGQRVRFTR